MNERRRDSAHRADAVDVWPYRRLGDAVELVLIHRVAGTGGMPPFWQGVSGGVDDGETAVQCALRELAEETGLGALDLFRVEPVFSIYLPDGDRILSVVAFAALVAADAEPVLSDEHDAWRWASIDEALDVLPFPAQRAAVAHLRSDLIERSDRAHLYRVELPGSR